MIIMWNHTFVAEINSYFLNQARASRRPVHTWFLEIALVHTEHFSNTETERFSKTERFNTLDGAL